jgi:hypothetical protein
MMWACNVAEEEKTVKYNLRKGDKVLVSDVSEEDCYDSGLKRTYLQEEEHHHFKHLVSNHVHWRYAVPVQDEDGWIEWNADEEDFCPVDDDVMVDVVIDSGGFITRRAGSFAWLRSIYNIKKYRIHKEERGKLKPILFDEVVDVPSNWYESHKKKEKTMNKRHFTEDSDDGLRHVMGLAAYDECRNFRGVVEKTKGIEQYKQWLDDKGYTFAWEKERTWKMGDVLRDKTNDEDYRICHVGQDEFALISMNDGEIYASRINVSDPMKITNDDINRMTDGDIGDSNKVCFRVDSSSLFWYNRGIWRSKPGRRQFIHSLSIRLKTTFPAGPWSFLCPSSIASIRSMSDIIDSLNANGSACLRQCHTEAYKLSEV